jgi:pyruvate kinase
MGRRTKIVATIGPASDDPATLRAMIDAGVDVARVGLAHGPVEDSIARVERIRAAAKDAGKPVGVLADLPGPKVRAGAFPDGGVFLAEGDVVNLRQGRGRSTATDIEVDHQTMLEGLVQGDRVALGDGGLDLRVLDVDGDRAAARVVSGGRVQGRPGVVLPPALLKFTTPTYEDLRLLDAAIEADIDMVAVSFVTSGEDMAAVRSAAAPAKPFLVAKIETQAAVDDLDAILDTADGVMVARGDLGVRLPLEDVPSIQKQIIRQGVLWVRPVITATQMLESMVNAPAPTRAEVSDVHNAVHDGTSAVMLSGETAIGHHPVSAVRWMHRIVERAERDFDHDAWGYSLGEAAGTEDTRARITGALTAAAWRAAQSVGAAAIVCATRSGETARAMARFRPAAPLLAVTPSPRTARQLTLSWGTLPVVVEARETTDDIVWFAVEEAVARGLARVGDVVAVLAGSPDDPEPATDVLRLVRVR